jgi:isoleucyl-tRNA synthetase
VKEGQSKFLGTLWNTYAFYVLYAEIDQFNPTEHALDYDKLSVMDKWLLSKMNSMIQKTDANMAAYKLPEAAAVLEEFVDDLSNWYVRRGRERFWAKGMEQDKINAYMTLYTALKNVCLCAAPMIPFMTEEIYQNIVRSVDSAAPESIHLCRFPEADASRIDTQLESDMDQVLKIVVMGRACRNTSGRKNRQPLSRMYVKSDRALDEFYREIIEDELNVKSVEFADDVRAYTTYAFKPQLRTVGPKYGKQLGGIKSYLAGLDGNAAMDELNEKGTLTFEVGDTKVELTKEDLLIEMAQKPGYVSQEDGGMTVVIDTNLTDELVEEGFVYEIISKIQTMRKDSGFEVMDHIHLSLSGNDKLYGIVKKNEAAISTKVLSDGVQKDVKLANEKEWDINGEKLIIGVEKQ